MSSVALLPFFFISCCSLCSRVLFFILWASRTCQVGHFDSHIFWFLIEFFIENLVLTGGRYIKTNEVTDLISFISWLPVTATLMYLLLPLGIEVNQKFLRFAKQKDVVRVSPLAKIFCACYFGFVRLFFAISFKCLQRVATSIFSIFAT